MRRAPVTLVAASCIFCAFSRELSIVDFGAIPRAKSVDNAVTNGVALYAALRNATDGDVVVVPAGHRFEMIPPRDPATGLVGVGLRIDGAVAGYDAGGDAAARAAWPLDGGAYAPLIRVEASARFSLYGYGAIDGRGHAWWWAFLLGELKSKRPLAVSIEGSSDVLVADLAILDSPRFNIYLGAFTSRAIVRNVTILADWESQRSLWGKARDLRLPMFPFNTDGIDVAGADVLIEGCTIANWDDVIAVKPSDALDDAGAPSADGCTRNVTVRKLLVYRGAGLSVGSVHPSPRDPCVEGVSFEDIDMYGPVKGVYVKPDAGGDECETERCAASISNVVYRRIAMTSGASPPGWAGIERRARARALASPAERVGKLFSSARAELARKGSTFTCSPRDYACMAWPIYIGTQQQLEPDGTGSGVWAPTEPRVTVTNLTLDDVKAHGGEWPMAAAVLRCNATNPCTGLFFKDVVLDADLFAAGQKYVCDDDRDAFGTTAGKIVPDASPCLAAAR